MPLDYIIVGQGLAGSLLSYQLIRRGRKVRVYDHLPQGKSSMVAAGIYNPFTGRKMVKTWKADKLFPYLGDFYRSLEENLQVQLIHDLPMYRPFLSVKEQNEWGARVHEPGYKQYINHIVSPSESFAQVVNPLGGLMLKQCGYVDTSALITSIKKLLHEQEVLELEKFNTDELVLNEDSVNYRDLQARRVIFCEGPWQAGNKFFNWLPLRPVKGEIIDILIDDSISMIVNRGVFVLPYAKNRCKVGATFNNKQLDWEASDQGKQQLESRLAKLLRIPYQVVDHVAGVRPATADRRPFAGIHPEFEPLAVFNGLGTKGVSLAPYLTANFLDFLEAGKPLIPDVNISRYFSLYYNKI